MTQSHIEQSQIEMSNRNVMMGNNYVMATETVQQSEKGIHLESTQLDKDIEFYPP
jgi:hypothetical protein